jgi:hypothetical protein
VRYGRNFSLQLFFRSNGELAYGRARHYRSRVNGKPLFDYHIQSVEFLKTLLKTQSISLTTEKAIDGQLGQIKNGDLENYGNGFNQQKSWGHRLAWSRLVDLGSIDSGSNPGGPTIIPDSNRESILECFMFLIYLVKTGFLYFTF